jgi:hypothetical protein
MTDTKQPPQYECHFSHNIITPETDPIGVIFVRFKVGDKFKNVPMCTICWEKTRGDATPTRVTWARLAADDG